MRITRKLTSIIALSVMVAALLAVVAVTQSSTANAQVVGRAISNLQLSHNDSGDLLISWDAPELAPRDYRVMWADSDENYKTWTDTTGNAFPTSASHTVSGLDREHEYKVKVRARYNNGSGPWSAEATHTIPEEQRRHRRRRHRTHRTGCRAPCPTTWQCSTGRTSRTPSATRSKCTSVRNPTTGKTLLIRADHTATVPTCTGLQQSSGRWTTTNERCA